MFFLNTQSHTEVSHDTKADVLDSVMVHSHYNEEKAIRDELGNNDDAVVVIGIDGKISFVSWDYEKITGLAPDDMEEQLFFSYVHPEDLATIFGAFGKVIEGGKAVTMVGPYRVLTNSGEYKVNMASLYPLKENDKVTRIAITVKEISQEMLEHPDTPPKKVLPTKKTSTKKTIKQNDIVKPEVKVEAEPELETHPDEQIMNAKQVSEPIENLPQEEVANPTINPEKETNTTNTKTDSKSAEKSKTHTNGPTLKGYKEKNTTPHNQPGTPQWIMSDEMAYINKF
jgi:PAS domain S-box-containing protein